MKDLFETLVEWRREGRRAALCTIIAARGSIPSQRSARLLVGEDGTLVGTVGGGCVEADVWQAAREAIESGAPRLLTFNLNKDPASDDGLVCGGTLEVYVEPLIPAPVVYLFGAGHVGHAVYQIACLAGFEVVVCDDREAFANRERFPEAREVLSGDLDSIFARLKPNRSSLVVIATRGHRDDLRVLRWAVGTPARYLGMLGSRRKVIGVRRELEAAGVPAERLEQLHAPVGIELGAQSPGEIAVSIVAELIALRRGCAALLPHLRDARPKPSSAPAAPPRLATAPPPAAAHRDCPGCGGADAA